MKDIPGIDAQAGHQQHRVADAEQDETCKELAQSASAGRGDHGMEFPGSGRGRRVGETRLWRGARWLGAAIASPVSA
jgi:hypothetical protein